MSKEDTGLFRETLRGRDSVYYIYSGPNSKEQEKKL